MTPGKTMFGTTRHGETVDRVVLSNGTLSAAILTYGAALQDVRLTGTDYPLTIGSTDLADYEGDMRYTGTLIGPVINRIRNARATIDGTEHRFQTNLNGRHTIHSGSESTQEAVWTIDDLSDTHVDLSLALEDGRGGFPGNRRLTARFKVQDAALTMTLQVQTDATTMINLANHSYWRLDAGPTYAGHTLTIGADRYLPLTSENLPTGKIADVTGTELDFRKGRALRADATDRLDVNFCVSEHRVPLRDVATLRAPSGLTMTMATTEPGLQIFDGHILGLPKVSGLDGERLQPFAGLAMEAQFWPDATNNPDFPSVLLHPDEPWEQITQWRFARG